jgi:hypothetical protein
MTTTTQRALRAAAIGTAIAVVVVGTGAVGSASAQAVLDSSAPVLSSVKVSNSSPYTGAVINETVGASDIGTGISFIVVSIRDEVGKTHTLQGGKAGDLPLPVDSSWAVGPAQVTEVTMFDDADNYAVYERDGSATVLENGSFTFQRHAVDFSAGDFTISEKPAVVPFDQVSAPLVVAGSAQVGGTMTALPGAWTPTPTTTSLQWLADGRALVGETRPQLALTAALVGKVITVAQTGSRSGYIDQTVVSESSPTVRPAPGVEYLVGPSTAGAARVGETLVADVGRWEPGTTFRIQWNADGEPIDGATGLALLLTDAQRGKAISVAVTGVIDGRTDTTAVSSPTPSVAASLRAFSPSVPVIEGTPRAGSTLAVRVGTWTPTPTTWTYQWLRNGQRIAGATKSTFVVPSSSVGSRLAVTVTGGRAGYESSAVSSAESKPVAALKKLTSTPKPKISGTARVGKVLTASAGKWSPAPVTLSYQWSMNGTAITGATKSTLKILKSSADKTITVSVTGKKNGYETVKQTSAKTGKVAK